jgi:hypothetical protein
VRHRRALPPRGNDDAAIAAEIFNVTNFALPVGTLPNALPNNSLAEAGKMQPGQPYTSVAVGTFGRLTSTVGRTVGLGTARQIQLAVRFNF